MLTLGTGRNALVAPVSTERASMVRKRSQLVSKEPSNASMAAREAWLMASSIAELKVFSMVQPHSRSYRFV